VDQSFPPHARFHHGRDFGRAFRRGVRVHGRHCLVVLAPRPRRGGRRARLGVTVSTKVDKRAVRRHQLKRWVRELFRRELAGRLHAHDLVVSFKQAPPADGHAELDGELRRSVAKAESALTRRQDQGR